MDLTKNHIYLIGYLQGQYAQIRRFQARLVLVRKMYADDQHKQLEFDRMANQLEEQLEEVVDRLFSIPRSN